MYYTLKISEDFGIIYSTERTNTDIEILKKDALYLEKQKKIRWVIVNDEDIPICWSTFLECSLRAPIDRTIATDDVYLRQIAEKQGRKVITGYEAHKLLGGSLSEKEFNRIPVTPTLIKSAARTLTEMEKQGMLEILKTGIKEEDIGEKVFGDN